MLAASTVMRRRAVSYADAQRARADYGSVTPLPQVEATGKGSSSHAGIINNLTNELQFTEYHRRRGEIRDGLRFGVYPNLVKALALYNAFLADYGPGGALYDAELWQYYLSNIAPIAVYQNTMMQAAAAIVGIMENVEAAAPGTFGIELPVAEPV